MRLLLDKKPSHEGLNANYFNMQKQLNDALKTRALELKQKAKEKRLTKGDECSEFFYTKMT